VAERDPEGQARIAVFLQGLQQLGWTDGRNMRLDYRWGEGNADNLRKYAAELAALAPDIILVYGGSAVGPLLQATKALVELTQQGRGHENWSISIVRVLSIAMRAPPSQLDSTPAR
jgi:hypothetical protein